jgi:glycosyltransferase involved in cell wall biosynthesis
LLVGINAQKALERETGVGVYAANLVQALTRLPETRDSLRLMMLHGREALRPRAGGAPIDSPEWSVRGVAPRILWEQFGLPRRAKRLGVDVLHYVDHALPLWGRPCPVVITVHDLAFYRLPQMYGTARRFYKCFIGLRSIRRAAHIIAASEATKRDIIEIAGTEEHQITTIHYGNDLSLFGKNESQGQQRGADSSKPYFLFVGDLQPRKNASGLIASFAQIVRGSDLPHELVLVGPPSPSLSKLERLAGQLRIADRVRFLGAVPHDDLGPIYRRATALVYPSWYEGFGLPPLEAMACGVPAIVSNRTSLPEVVGDAGLLVAPDDVRGLAAAMVRVALDAELAADLSRRGKDRANQFSWDECARRTWDVYRRVYEESRNHARA